MHNYESHRESKILFENNRNSKRWHSLKGSKFTPHRYTISPRPFTSFPSLVRATRPCHEHGRNNNNNNIHTCEEIEKKRRKWLVEDDSCSLGFHPGNRENVEENDEMIGCPG